MPLRNYSLTHVLHENTSQEQVTPAIEQVQVVADISCSALCCHSNETRAPIANPPNIAQLGASPGIPSSYIRVCAVVWECGDGQTDRQMDRYTHTDKHDQYTFRVIYDSHEMQ